MATAKPSRHRARPEALPVAGASFLLLAATIPAAQAGGAVQSALLLLGASLGITLYHGAFGFTAAWRRFLVTGDARGVRAQMLMLAVAMLLFFPALAAGHVLGRPVAGWVVPAGVAVAAGAFIFGIGMQLGGGCGSGTLYTVGGGSVRMVVTLASFIVGSVVATAHMPFWDSLSALPAWSFVERLGLVPAVAANLALLAVMALAATGIERARGVAPTASARPNLLRGPWPLLAAAVLLAVLNFATLCLAGRPWGITSAFALWGAKALAAIGVDVAGWPYWRARTEALEASIWTDVTSVMDVGIVLGAALAAGFAGRFRPSWRLTRPELLTAVLGGLLLGYGARVSTGCNIGAFFSGVASGSLHGWLWLVAALAGNLMGTRLRPICGLSRL